MLDFSQGWVWFVGGLAITALAGLFVVSVVLAARHAEARAARRARDGHAPPAPR